MSTDHCSKWSGHLLNMFLTSLAVLNLISGLVEIPFVFICQTKNILKVCVSWTIFIRFTAISSVCHVIFIAFDHYLAIVHYLQHDSIVTKWRATGATLYIQMSWYSADKTALEDYEKNRSFRCKVHKSLHRAVFRGTIVDDLLYLWTHFLHFI